MLCAQVHLLPIVPCTAQRLDDAQYAQLQQTMADSPLRDCDLRARPLSAADRSALARLARERRLTTLVWAGLQLGDAGAAQLLQELTAESEPCAVTALDLRRNGLTTLPLELLRLTALTTLRQCRWRIGSVN